MRGPAALLASYSCSGPAADLPFVFDSQEAATADATAWSVATISGCGQDVADASPEWRTCATGTNAIGTNGRTAEARDAHADTIEAKHGG